MRKRDQIEQLEAQLTLEAGRTKRLQAENDRLGTLLEGYPAMEIALQDSLARNDELLLLLQDAERRVKTAENTIAVKERVIVELKELRLDTSGRDRKIEELERRLVGTEGQNQSLWRRIRAAQEVLDG